MALVLKYDLRRQPSACTRGLRVRRLLMCCAAAVLLVSVAYMAARYGFNAVVRCEVETHGALGQGGGALSQIALSNACGF